MKALIVVVALSMMLAAAPAFAQAPAGAQAPAAQQGDRGPTPRPGGVDEDDEDRTDQRRRLVSETA